MKYSTLYGLQPADRIIEPIFQTGLTKHHAIYLGIDRYGYEMIAENYQFHGVRKVKASEYFREGKSYSFQKFTGSWPQRMAAIQRANSLVGQHYDLFNFNCEHYAEYVQTGSPKSYQMEFVQCLVGLFSICSALHLFALTTKRSGR